MITTNDVQKIATAIATANGHPDPAGWATKVAEAFVPDPAPVASSDALPAPVVPVPEVTLNPPAIDVPAQ